MATRRTSMGPQTYRYNGAIDMQARTRTARNFEKTESDLSQLSASRKSSHKPSQSKSIKTVKLFRDALGYLGSKNPIPPKVTAEHEVWLLDNTAYRNVKTGKWEAEYVAAIFAEQASQESFSVMEAAAGIANKLDMKDNDPQYETLQKRLRPFLQDMLASGQVEIVQPNKATVKLPPAGRNGISTNVKPVGDNARSEQFFKSRAAVPKGVTGILEMKTFCAEPEGWGVISDIDDTIKVTQTSDPIGILKTTFVDEPEVCAGMPELYRNISSLIKETSPWFYLSSSPYNLYPFLHDFNAQHYPHGTIILRDQNWLSLPGLLSNLTLGTEDYKVDRMEKINSWLPKRKMICIGDSTQSDPESYGEIYHKFPGWVKLILIRKVQDAAAVGIDEKNQPERFEKAFKDVPKDAWHVFEDAAECNRIVEAVVRGKP